MDSLARNFDIVPDYRKDFSVVLEDLVCAWIKDSNKLECLLYAGVGIFDRRSFDSLPSWTPNFLLASPEGTGLVFFENGHADQGVFAAATRAQS